MTPTILKKTVVMLVLGALIASVSTVGLAATPRSDLLKYIDVDVVDTTQYAKAPPWKIGFSNASISNSWRVFLLQELKYEASKHKEIGELYITDAEDKPAKQIADTEDLLAKGIDLLIISPATAEALNAVVDKAMKRGVPVITVDRNVTTPNYVCFIESSSYEMGRIGAEWLAKELKGKGNIVMLSGIAGSSPAEDRLRAARDVFKRYPDIKILAHAYTDWSPSKTKEIMAGFLQKFPRIDGVWCDGGIIAVGAIEAYVDAGKKIPPITGEDLNRYLKMWKRYGFEGIGISYPVWQSKVAIQKAVDVLRGLPVPRYIDVPRTVIEKKDLAKYVREDLPDEFFMDNTLPEEWLPKK